MTAKMSTLWQNGVKQSTYVPVLMDKRKDEMSTLLEPRYVDKIDVYRRVDDDWKLDRSYYFYDLNECLTKIRCDFFINRKGVKVVSSCGYVEVIA